MRSRQKIDATKNSLTEVLGTDGGDETHQQKIQEVAELRQDRDDALGHGNRRFWRKSEEEGALGIYRVEGVSEG